MDFFLLIFDLYILNFVLYIFIYRITIDTEANRVAMPKADFSSWTPCDEFASLLFKLVNKNEKAVNGGMYSFVTQNNKTTVNQL